MPQSKDRGVAADKRDGHKKQLRTGETVGSDGSSKKKKPALFSRLSCLFCIVGVRQQDDCIGRPNASDQSTQSIHSSQNEAKETISRRDENNFQHHDDELPYVQSCLNRSQSEIPGSILVGKIDQQSESIYEAKLQMEGPSDITFVDGVTWQQNYSPENRAKYSGPVISDNVPHGRGILQFASGDTYDGPFQNGKMHGSDGIFMTQKGSVYVGGFLENLKHGHGKQTMLGKRQRYFGSYEHGIPHGFGEAYNVDGSLYHKGQWEAGTPSHKMIPFNPKPIEGDDDSAISEFLQTACDASFASTVDPMISRYDNLRAVRLDSDDSSIDSDSCFSDITGSAFESESTYDGGARFQDNDEEDHRYRNVGSILSLGPLHTLSAESLRKHMTMTTAEMEKYQSLRASIEKQPRHDRNTSTDVMDNLNPASLYGRRISL